MSRKCSSPVETLRAQRLVQLRAPAASALGRVVGAAGEHGDRLRGEQGGEVVLVHRDEGARPCVGNVHSERPACFWLMQRSLLPPKVDARRIPRLSKVVPHD
jgi:hypothetical protein